MLVYIKTINFYLKRYFKPFYYRYFCNNVVKLYSTNQKVQNFIEKECHFVYVGSG